MRDIERDINREPIKKMLEEVGFKEIEIFGDFTMEEAKDDSERIFFSAIKR